MEGPGALLHLVNQVWLDQLVRARVACLFVSSEVASTIEAKLAVVAAVTMQNGSNLTQRVYIRNLF